MNGKKAIPACLIVAGLLVFAGLKLWTFGPQVTHAQTVTISKAWWPVWDTFQIGTAQREEVNRSFQTTFLQSQDYVAALSDFQTGKADAATLTIYEAILAAAEGVDLKIVLLLDYTTGSDGVVARKNIRSLSDLKGKRIGVEQGTIAHFTVLKALEKAGLDQTEVQLVNLNLKALQQAFLRGEIDAAGTYEPYMSTLASQGDGHVVFSSREIPRSICDVLFVKASLAREHPETIDHWVEAWNGALIFKGSEPEKHLRALNKLNGTPVPDIRASFNGIFFTNLGENRIAIGTRQHPGYLLESLKEMETFMLAQGVIQDHVDLENMVDYEAVHRFFER